ncbi:MAG: L-lysine 6-transaminase [Candidatus Aminicenantes bacterium]|nr:L-lysine 6-transaminase [Candidatus Aminicenantes bacterium]
MSDIQPKDIHSELSKHLLVDGYDMVLDLERSEGAYIYDSVSGKKYLDFFTFFASGPVGLNHPKLLDPDWLEKVKYAVANKPSNSDVYTTEMAACVNAFSRVAIPAYLPHLFFVSGGALAVENCLKTAFDWKVRKNFAKGIKEEKGHQVIHFKDAFHGRSGYTMSLTNTDPVKTDYFPKFKWPRVSSPFLQFPLTEESLQTAAAAEKKTLEEIKKAIRENPGDIAAILLEPIQCEGGDHHFRKEFFQALRAAADENEILLILDEVQTGLGMTGKMWCHQHFDIEPDMIAFGKKTQVCGLLASKRIDEIDDNVFSVSGRINSTFGGNLMDMVRFEKYLEIIEEEKLVENAAVQGDYLLSGLTDLQKEFPGKVSNARGMGLICAFDMPDAAKRNEAINKMKELGMIILSCGPISIRCRPRLNVTREEIDEALRIMREAIKAV